MTEQEVLVGVVALERTFGMKRSWWYSMAEARTVPSYKVGKYRLFRISEIAAWLEQHRSGPLTNGTNGTITTGEPAPHAEEKTPAPPRVPRTSARRTRARR